jgi:vacuolar-type H+-ATPase subunit I/STV1
LRLYRLIWILSEGEIQQKPLFSFTTYRLYTRDKEAMNAISFLQQKIQDLERELESIDQKLATLQQNIDTCYNNLRNVAYRLYTMFTYSEANYNRHWVYMYDWKKERWLKYSDSEVTEADIDEITRDTPLTNEIPYCLICGC